MKLRCIYVQKGFEKRLSDGGIYDAIYTPNGWVAVIDDNGGIIVHPSKHFKEIEDPDSIIDLQKANGQITEMIESLRKAVNNNTCEIGRMSAILEVTAITAEEAMKKKPTCQESRQVEEPKPEKRLYLNTDDGSLNICYGTGADVDDECLWYVDSEDGKTSTSTIMPKLWNEWQEGGYKFDPTSVKWKGMSDKKKYRLVLANNGSICLKGTDYILDVKHRVSEILCTDKNILTDKAGRAFIV